MTHANDALIKLPAYSLSEWGGKMISEHQTQEPLRIVPHPRTQRKARENVKHIVNSGVSLRKIRRYLHHFVIWWVKTVEIWHYEELLHSFIDTCWEINPAAIAAGLLQKRVTLLGMHVHLNCLDIA